MIGKGIVRFHAVYWPAILLSAGEPLPTKIFVHPYLTAGGEKLSKSSGQRDRPGRASSTRSAPTRCAGGSLRDVPRTVDADFTVERVVARSDEDLAHGVGNLVHRIVTMVHRLCDGTPSGLASARTRRRAACRDRRRAPRLRLPARGRGGARPRRRHEPPRRRHESVEARAWVRRAGRARSVSSSPRARLIGELLEPFVPDTSARVVAALTLDADGRLPDAQPVVRLLEPTSR